MEKLCKCGGKLAWVKKYDRFYCSKCSQYPPLCPSCGRDLFWITKYERYYCGNCAKYPDVTTPKVSTQPIKTYSPTQIQTVFDDLKEKYRVGLKDEALFRKLGRSLKFLDEKGTVWAVGLETGKWYYYKDKRWVEGQPPGILIP